MKGSIVMCLQALVESKLGKPGWEQVMREGAMAPTTIIMPSSDVPDASVLKLLAATCKVAGFTREAAFDAFGDFWVNNFVPKAFPHFFKNKSSAKEFLIGMDEVHNTMTRNMPSAKPPRFKFEDKGPKALVMEYSSSRGLADLMPGLIKGVARKYGERVSIKRSAPNRFELAFS